MAIDVADFKQVMSRWGSGVTVVTIKAGEVVHGMTASAFCSVSLEPPLILVCVGKKQSSHAMLKTANRFIVNLLAEDQHTLSDHFARPRAEGKAQFDSVPHSLTAHGEPCLDGCLAAMHCKVWSVADGGDHDIFVGEVERVEINQRVENPLLYYRGKYRKLAAL